MTENSAKKSIVDVWLGVLINFVKFTGKHLRQSPFFNKVAGLSLWHMCFPVNFAKFPRTSLLQDTSGRLLFCVSHKHIQADKNMFKVNGKNTGLIWKNTGLICAHFWPTFRFKTPWIYQETFGFLVLTLVENVLNSFKHKSNNVNWPRSSMFNVNFGKKYLISQGSDSFKSGFWHFSNF